jgi:heat shock protein HtpX
MEMAAFFSMASRVDLPATKMGLIVFVPWVWPFVVIYAITRPLAMVISRARELLADQWSATTTGNPSQLASALVKLSDELGTIPNVDLRKIARHGALLCLDVHRAGGGRVGFLSEHPPLHRRLKRLAKMSSGKRESPGRG